MADTLETSLRTARMARKELKHTLGEVLTIQDWNSELFCSSETHTIRAVVTPNEINHAHGTGVLLNRLFKHTDDVLHIRSRNTYDGQQSFSHNQFLLSYSGLNRAQCFRLAAEKLKSFELKSIFLVPYFRDDFITGLVLKYLYDVPLCTYLMDDTNLAWSYVDDALVREVLSISDIRFAISRELTDALEAKWQLKTWFVPAVAPAQLIMKEENRSVRSSRESSRGVLMGNLWNPAWLEALLPNLRQSGHRLDWFGGGASELLKIDTAAIAADGIDYLGFLGSEAELCSRMREYDFLVVLTGCNEDSEQFQAISKFSLPSKITFATATCNIPILLVGEPNSAAANFVKAMGIGEVCNYSDIKRAMLTICDENNQATYRKNAAKIAETLSDKDFDTWIADSINLGQAKDLRFEQLMPKPRNSTVRFVETSVPEDLYGDFVEVYQVFRRLLNSEYTPDFVIDVGASIGIWSHAVSKLFPHARYLLIEPLYSRYPAESRQYFMPSVEKIEILEIAISDQTGEMTFNVSDDLFGSSLLKPADFRRYEPVSIPTTTLDLLAAEKNIHGRGILKIDVQYAEHIVLAGATSLLERVDVLVIETSLVRYTQDSSVFHELLALVYSLGFVYFDDAGGWRSPHSGRLLEKDIVLYRAGAINDQSIIAL